MNAEALNYFSEKLDWIVFNMQVVVQSQSEKMKPLPSEANKRDVFERFRLLDSIREVLLGLLVGDEYVLLCINSTIGGKAGWYDYIYCREKDEGEDRMIKWCIFDRSTLYMGTLALQQAIQEDHLRLNKTMHKGILDIRRINRPEYWSVLKCKIASFSSSWKNCSMV
jgi:hypothetical protein